MIIYSYIYIKLMAGIKSVRLISIIVICLTIKIITVNGRKCVCTSKACLAAGVDTCRTRFSCYTELILTNEGQGSNTTTRGCTESATPLLCENRPISTGLDINDTRMVGNQRVRWPRLRCCDSYDYCNGGGIFEEEIIQQQEEDNRRPMSTQNREPVVNPAGDSLQAKTSDPPDRYQDKKSLDYSSSSSSTSISTSIFNNNGRLNSLSLQQVKPLHVAALVLAISALISVLAACYVITRLLKYHPYPSNSSD